MTTIPTTKTTPMRIFILEDDPERVRWLTNRLIGHDLTIVDSCTKADQFVPPYDLILFDHDLGGRQLAEHEDCGETFARLIVDRIGDARVIVHSYNFMGAMHIIGVIGYGTYAPFRGPLFIQLLDEIEAEFNARRRPSP